MNPPDEPLLSVIIPTFRPTELLADESPERSARAAVESAGDGRTRHAKMATPSEGPALVRNTGISAAIHTLQRDSSPVEESYAPMHNIVDYRALQGASRALPIENPRGQE